MPFPTLVGAGSVDFARDVRPIFETSCFGCHGAEKQKGGYRLDRRRDAFKGGDSGEAAIAPHRPDASPLLRFVSGEDPDLFMPPKKSDAAALSSSQLDLLREWIAAGAPWPDELSGDGADDRLTHWAWQPLEKPAIPSGAHTNPIDAFISTKLAEKEIEPAPPADRRTLIRRLYFDLHGLAPTLEEIAVFEHDADPLAYENLVDRLLASPHYGERWARHWFDAIHFADTHGFEHDRIREHAWRYRDYVITALNTDTSWPQFVREQLAADVFSPDQPRLTAALGFLGAGPFDQSAAGTAPKMFEVVDRDDMIVQTMAAFTSTTAGCARCHDHKFDPIPQKEYYALAAVFAGVAKGDISYDEDASVARERRHWQAIAAAADKGDRAILLGSDVRRLVGEWEQNQPAPADWALVAPDEINSEGGATLERRDDGSVLSSGPRPDKETLTITGRSDLEQITALRLELLADDSLPHRGPGRQDNGNVHTSEVELYIVGADTPQKLSFRKAVADFDQAGQPITNAIDGKENTDWGIYPRVGESHIGVFELEKPVTIRDGERLKFVLKHRYGQGHISGRVRVSVTGDDPARTAPIPSVLAAALATPKDERDEAQQLVIAAHVARLRAAEAISRLPAQAMVYAAAPQVSRHGKSEAPLTSPRPINVLRRGDLNAPGDLVEPGALSLISAIPARFTLSDPNVEASRRAALAEWIVHPQNPLTWRSIVNRVWQGHFGRGIIDSVNDLGRMGATATHPELLEWLATEFRDSGGSLKRLHRLIVTSDAYKRASQYPAAEDHITANPDHARRSAELDADLKLLSRFPRRRLDAESLRDIVLQTAGHLDLKMGGPSVMHFKLGPPIQDTPVLDYTAFDWDQPGVNRRSIYRLVYRNIADPFMTALDFPDAAQLAPVRPFSASAPQALVLWNDAFVLRQSERFAERVQNLVTDPESLVRTAVRLAWLRETKPDELQPYMAFVDRHGLAAFCRVLFNSNEFLFVN